MKKTFIIATALALSSALLIPRQSAANTTETLKTSDANNTSSITGTTNWMPSTVSPTNTLATTYDFYVAHNLRLPAGGANYQIVADAINLQANGTLAVKGYGTSTFNNLVLAGGTIQQAGTGGTPDTGNVAGNFNLASNSVIDPSSSSVPGRVLKILANITNAPGVFASLTVSGEPATLVLSGQSTFNGNLTVNSSGSAGTNCILQLAASNALPAAVGLALQGGVAPAVLDLNGNNQTISNLTFTSGTVPAFITNSAPGTTAILGIGCNNSGYSNNVTGGVIADNPLSGGTVSLAKVGTSTLTLGASNTYSGVTTINAGRLALGSSGSINNSSNINIASGATFNVSAISSYTLSSTTTLSASGTGTNVDTNAAAICGASGGTVSLGSRPVTLTYDGLHPALYISQGTLSLNGNALTVNTTSGLPLAGGSYTIIQQASGNISSNGTFTVAGSAVGSGATAVVLVSGGKVILQIQTIYSYPLPSIYSTSQCYSVTVNGINIPVVNYTPEYDYAEFSMADTTATVQITALGQTEIYTSHISPVKLGLTGTTNGNTLTFTFTNNQYFIITIDGMKPFALCADPAEANLPPSSGSNIFNVVIGYGADNTGASLTTAPLRNAVNDASAYGKTNASGTAGIVYVPAGVYLCGNLQLKGNMALYLQGGSVLRCTGNPTNYSTKFGGYGEYDGIAKKSTTILYATNDSNLTIYGRGTVDGNGNYLALFNGTNAEGDSLLVPNDWTNLTVDGITFRDAAGWAVVPVQSTNVLFSNLKIFDNKSTNTSQDDCIDVYDSRGLIVSNTIAIAADDTFSTKSYVYGISNILVEDCLAWTRSVGCKIGWEVYTPQDNLTFSNIVCYNCQSGVAIEEYNGGPTGGSIVNHLTFEDIDIENNTDGNVGSQCWGLFNIQTTNGYVTNVLVKDITVRESGMNGSIGGTVNTNAIIDGITFDHISMPGSTNPAADLFSMDIFVLNDYTNLTILPVQSPLSEIYLTASDASGTSSFNSAGHWSDQQPPHDTNYFVYSLNLRTPTGTNYTFGGGSLTLLHSATLSLKNDGFTNVIGSNAATGLFLDSSTVNNVDASSDTLAGYVTLLPNGTGGTFQMPSAGSTFTITATVGGAGALQLGSSGGRGIIALTGTNTYTGGTFFGTAFAGPLTLQFSGAGTPGAINGSLSLNSNLDLVDLNGTAQSVGNFSGTAGIITNGSAAAAALTIGNADHGLGAFAGTIVAGSGSIALTKAGPGTAVLSGTNTYTGATTISNGTLLITGSLAPASAVAIDGGTLGGNGTVAGNVTVANNAIAIIHPEGGSTLTLNSNLTVNANSQVVFDLTNSVSSGDDQIVLGGGGHLTCNSAQITINSAGTLAATNYVLFNITGSASIAGSFNSAPAWLGITPANASSYSIVTGTNQVILQYTSGMEPGQKAIVVSPQPCLTGISLSGTALVISGVNDTFSRQYILLRSTSLDLSLNQWTPLVTNGLPVGNFTLTNQIDPMTPQSFYILRLP